MNQGALTYALKLLRRRDYSRRELGARLERRFPTGTAPILDWLEHKDYLNDRRFALSFVEAHPTWARSRMNAALEEHCIGEAVRNEILESRTWPSVREVVRARMNEMGMDAPLDRRAAARVARTLARMGHDPSEIADEMEALL